MDTFSMKKADIKDGKITDDGRLQQSIAYYIVNPWRVR